MNLIQFKDGERPGDPMQARSQLVGVVWWSVLVRSVPGWLVSQIEFWIAALPSRVLSSNGAGKDPVTGKARSRRDPHAVADAKEALKLETEAVLATMDLPRYQLVRLFLTGHIAFNARPRIEQCPRCLRDALGGESISACRCYRLTDPTNLGGPVTKPIPDALVKFGVIPDDSYKHVEFAVSRLERAEDVAHEGINVVVQEVEA